MWTLQALALPAGQQLSLFPSFAEVADELALEHDETQAAFLDSLAAAALTTHQKAAIRDLDRQLERMSGRENANTLWTVEALGTHHEWETVRSFARGVLAAMGWPVALPPLDRGTLFVSPPDDN